MEYTFLEKDENENMNIVSVFEDNESVEDEVSDEIESTNKNEITEESTKNETVQDISSENTEKLDLIHQDLGVICSFLIIFALVILFKLIYKFFDIFF